MNRKIIFVSLLSVFILLLLPSVPAVEYNVALDANESSIIDKIKRIKIDIKDLKERLKNMDRKELNEKIKNINRKELKEKINKIDIKKVRNELRAKLKDQQDEPKCIIISLIILRILLTIINYIISAGYIIISIILNTLALILNLIVAMINLILVIIVTIIKVILSTLIGIIDSILKTIFDILFPNRNTTELYH